MTKPTQTQIKDELAKLRAMSGKLGVSVFGDDNNASLEAQIRVLEENLDDTEIDELEDSGEFDESEAHEARNALNWLDGDANESLSSEWEPLVGIRVNPIPFQR